VDPPGFRRGFAVRGRLLRRCHEAAHRTRPGLDRGRIEGKYGAAALFEDQSPHPPGSDAETGVRWESFRGEEPLR